MNLKELVRGWFPKEVLENGKVDVESYGNEMVVVKVTNCRMKWKKEMLEHPFHMGLLITAGELHLTLNGERLGLLAPAYIDFIGSNRWENISMDSFFAGYLFVVDRNFFLEVASKLRTRISGKMMDFVHHPFVMLAGNESEKMEHLSAALYGAMLRTGDVFHRELVQNLLSASLCELWNAIFRHCDTVSEVEMPYHWGGIVSHFLYLAHTHCCEHHEVGWYCEQLGVSANALTSALKRVCGKTARNIIDELLVMEAKVALRNPIYSVQDVSDKLCFSDQSAFGKFFKRCCGISPINFRRKQEVEG